MPAVTEMLFAIGAGPQVVAVSSFDTIRPRWRRCQRVGALLDPDVERMLSLRPDLVVIYGTQTDLQQQLERASIPVFDYRHGGLADVTATMRGARRSAPGMARGPSEVAAGIERRIDGDAPAHAGAAAAPRAAGLRPRAGVAAQHLGQRRTGFLHDMLDAAGGVNVFADVERESVQATTELVLTRAPDVILELRERRWPDGAERPRRAIAGPGWRRCRPCRTGASRRRRRRAWSSPGRASPTPSERLRRRAAPGGVAR